MRRVQRRLPGAAGRAAVLALALMALSACSSVGKVELEIGNPVGGRALFAAIGPRAEFEAAAVANAPQQILEFGKLPTYSFYLQVSPRTEPSLHWEVDDPKDNDADVDFELEAPRETLVIAVDGQLEERAGEALAVILDCGATMELKLFRASDFAARSTHRIIVRNGHFEPVGD